MALKSLTLIKGNPDVTWQSCPLTTTTALTIITTTWGSAGTPFAPHVCTQTMWEGPATLLPRPQAQQPLITTTMAASETEGLGMGSHPFRSLPKFFLDRSLPFPPSTRNGRKRPERPVTGDPEDDL